MEIPNVLKSQKTTTTMRSRIGEEQRGVKYSTATSTVINKGKHTAVTAWREAGEVEQGGLTKC